jgi:hypothetical protein
MSTMPSKGILDLLDKADALLNDIKFMETLDPSAIRKEKIKIANARANLQEARRRLERSGQETPT